MKSNRSIPDALVIPVLVYPNVRKAVSWLCDTFGFSERLQIGEGHRSQLVIGTGAVIIAEARSGHSSPPGAAITHQVMVRVGDIDAHYERVLQREARMIQAPATFPYGERQYTVEDLAGHQWVFTETVRDVDPLDWGGILK